MKRRMLKYALGSLPKRVTITAPVGSEFKSIGVQEGGIAVWASVPDGQPLRPYRFSILFTGDTVNPEAERFLGTVTIDGLVYHVFEEQDPW